MSVKERKNAPFAKECGKCLRHPFLWIVCITFGLFQFLSIYTYVGNAGMRKELRQMHVAVTDEETASPEYESAYADYKKTYGGMYDTLDMRKILEQKEKRVDMNRKEPGECGLCAIMTGCRSGWNRSEKQGKARMPFIREVGINCTPLCMENCGRS